MSTQVVPLTLSTIQMCERNIMNILQHPKKIASLTALAIGSWFVISAAQAQNNLPPPPQSSASNNVQNGTEDQNYEPPSRVARVGYAFGNISFADAGSNQWVPLLANRPISTGDSVSVPDGGRAELQVGANALRLHERTRVSFITLNDENTQIQLSQGSLVLRVRALQERENFEINTPNLSFSIQEPGEYRINVNDDNTSTVMIRRGIGVAQGDRDIITLREGEQTRFSGTNLNHTQIARVPPFDSFDQWAADRDRAEENSISARYVPRDMVGYQQLDEYGIWDTHVEYGAIWYPRGISVGWAPYRDGKWVWVAPWGWTWVDRAPWGFAPYHYGRWAYVGKRWGWVPGRYERHHRAVYAPALVAWVGVGSGGLSAGINLSSRHSHGPSVSWFPLGPGEVYHPHYTRSSRYIQHVNQTVIVNHATVINRSTRGYDTYRNDRYRNQHVHNAITSVPTQTFVRGDHVFPASSSLRTSDTKNIRVNLDGPNLVPEKNNRFGDARPRNWQENDQLRSRPTISGSSRGEPIKINDAGRINRYDDHRSDNRSDNRTIDNDRFGRADRTEVRRPEIRTESSLATPNTIPQSRSLNATDRSSANAQRFERPTQTESRGFNSAESIPQQNATIATQAPNNSSSGIRTVEEMSAERNNQRIRINRIDPIREYRNDVNSNPTVNPMPQSNAEMSVNRPVNISNERNVERVDRFDRADRSDRIERRVDRADRAPERMQERIQERPQATIQREMPREISQPRQEVRMAEPRRETAPVMRVERPEREKTSENKKESRREVHEQ
jgi:hypothetical protein